MTIFINQIQIFQARNTNTWMIMEFVAETARSLIEKGSEDDFLHIVEISTVLLQGNLVMKKVMLLQIFAKCDLKRKHAKMLKYYLELDELLNDSVLEKRTRIDTLLDIGKAYLETGHYNNTIKYTLTAQNIADELEDMPGKARCWANLGNAAVRLGDYQNAIEYYNKGLAICTEMGDWQGIASNNANLGIVCCNIGQYEKAIEYCNKGLAISNEREDWQEIASNNGNLGNAYFSMGQYEKASEYYDKGLALCTELRDWQGIANNSNNLGNAFRELGQYGKAIEYYNKGLAISTDIGDRFGMASSNSNLGNAYHGLGQYENAVECYNVGLGISAEIGDQLGMATSNGSLGNANLSLGQYERAIEYCNKGIAISNEIGDKSGLANTYGNLGNAYLSLGQYEKAIEYYNIGLGMSIKIGFKFGIANNNGDLGVAYYKLGQYEKAVLYFEQGLAISTDMGDQTRVAIRNGNLGNAYYSLGQYNRAIEYYDRGLAFSTEITDQLTMAINNANLGCVYCGLDQYKKAIKYFTKGLEISVQIKDPWGESVCLGNIGLTHLLLIRSVNCETETLRKLQLAVSFSSRSVKCNDKIFLDLCVDKNKLSFMNEYFERYTTLMYSFILLKRIEAALLVIDLGKAKALQTFIMSRQKSERADKTDYADKVWQVIDEGQEKEKICDIRRHIQLAENSSTVLFYSFDHERFLNIWVLNDEDDVTHISLKVTDATESTKDYICKNLIDLHSTLNVNLTRSSSFFHETVTNFTPGVVKLEELLWDRRPLANKVSDTAEISATFLSSNFKHAQPPGLKLRDSSLQNETTVPSAETFKMLKAVENLDLAVDISKRNCRYKTLEYLDLFVLSSEVRHHLVLLRELFVSLIHPIREVIKGTKLIIVPDKFLFFVPFSALLDEDGYYLSKRYSIQVTPSLHTLYTSMSITEHVSLGPALFVGNPTVGTVSFKGAEWDIPRLPFATKEVEFLASLFDGKPLLQRRAVKCEVLKHIHSSSIIHIAAHGNKTRGEIFLAPNPGWQQQGLKLPNESFYLLKESDIIGIDIKARLVVLSCCHTSKGKLSSEGVIGLARSFLAAGARCVVTTLWPLHDKAAKLFMRSFYGAIIGERSVCEALKGTTNMFQRHQKRFCRLFSIWAPFTIFGEDVKFSAQDIEGIKKQSRENRL